MKIVSKVWSPRVAATTLAIALGVGGVVAFGLAYARQPSSPPRPPLSSAGRVDPTPASTMLAAAPAMKPRRSVSAHAVGLAASPPIEISIPAIGVTSTIVDLGRNPDGSVEVPSRFHVVGWYKFAVTPGQVGPAVFLGHVDSQSGPGVFYRLGRLHIGDRVVVKRGDGRSVTFAITGVREYAKVAFPSIDVYGNTAKPTIRLVTCGGAFDAATHHYLSNVVAFGEMV